MNVSTGFDNGSSVANIVRDHIGKTLASKAGSENTSKAGNAATAGSSASNVAADSVSLSKEAAGAASASASEATSSQPACEQSEDVSALASKMAGGDEEKLDDYVLCSGTDEADEINVRNGDDGGLVVSVNGEERVYTAAEAKKLILDAGAGDDTITVADDVKQNMYMTGGDGDDKTTGGAGNDVVIDNYGSNAISGGDGDDTLVANGNSSRSGVLGWWDKLVGNNGDNSISGGAGNDYIEGGFGNDAINGGEGDDVIYGLSGDDAISAGNGDDYVDGGKGKDSISGGAGTDRLFGGRGNDSISGGDGDDVIAGGRGADSISGGAGADDITGTTGWGQNDVISTDSDDSLSYVDPMTVPGNINAKGSDAFVERTESDLETLASTATGQTMLEGLRSTGKSVDIVATDGGNVCNYGTNGCSPDEDGNAGKGTDSTVNYNTSKISLGGTSAWSDRAPIVGLYHEMVHSYNAGTGTLDATKYNYDGDVVTSGGTAGCEFQAVGIDNGSVDLNEGISENDMRSYLNYARRERY